MSETSEPAGRPERARSLRASIQEQRPRMRASPRLNRNIAVRKINFTVEIHRWREAGEATFKWSRDNGSVATAWLGGEGSNLQVASTRGFTAGNWVELSDDNSELLGQPGTLVQLVKVEGSTLWVDSATTLPPIGNYPAKSKSASLGSFGDRHSFLG